MIDVKMRIDHVPDIVCLETKLLKLLVNCMIPSERLCAKSLAYSRRPILLSRLRICHNVVHPRVPQNEAVLGVLDDTNRRRYIHHPQSKRDKLASRQPESPRINDC